MSDNLTQLSDLDQLLLTNLEKDEINTEEIVRLVDKREQLLATVLRDIEQSPQQVDKQAWQAAIKRTVTIVGLMQEKTGQIGSDLKKYRHGNKSVQLYKKFS